MARRILDTNILVSYWNKRFHEHKRPCAIEDARGWARELIKTMGSNAIVSPVQIEVLAGTTTHEKLQLTRAFLGEFAVLDEGRISLADWQAARNYAERIPQNAKPRDLGDCLIHALADRLHLEVLSGDVALNQARGSGRNRGRRPR
ncbi:MAG TPA: PIN domain-containing protein [Lacipirellulaceae bacterium]|nr:PIN domain-containing protein [Lacipirellulaceae bacterium]